MSKNNWRNKKDSGNYKNREKRKESWSKSTNFKRKCRDSENSKSKRWKNEKMRLW